MIDTESRTGFRRAAQRMQHPAALLCLYCLACGAVQAGDDSHYSGAGFFDIHVCNWPDRPLFLMPLFSSERFAEIDRIEVFAPDDSFITELDLQRFRILKRKGKPEKRVFIRQIDMPDNATDGWYSARVKLTDGSQYRARDYVILSQLSQVSGRVPANESVLVQVPAELSWEPVTGAAHYQVFIRDLWNDSKLVYTSKLLQQPRLVLPTGLIESGGSYAWVIHARDTNEHSLLGDFNHGSLNRPATFSVD